MEQKYHVGDTITFKPRWGRYPMRKLTRKIVKVDVDGPGRPMYAVTSAYGVKGFWVEEREIIKT